MLRSSAVRAASPAFHCASRTARTARTARAVLSWVTWVGWAGRTVREGVPGWLADVPQHLPVLVDLEKHGERVENTTWSG